MTVKVVLYVIGFNLMQRCFVLYFIHTWCRTLC